MIAGVQQKGDLVWEANSPILSHIHLARKLSTNPLPQSKTWISSPVLSLGLVLASSDYVKLANAACFCPELPKLAMWKLSSLLANRESILVLIIDLPHAITVS